VTVHAKEERQARWQKGRNVENNAEGERMDL
jgi:hypothetical protein